MVAAALPHPRVKCATTTYDTKLAPKSVGLVAVAKCIAARGEQPIIDFETAVRSVWGEPRRSRTVRFPLHFRVGELR